MNDSSLRIVGYNDLDIDSFERQRILDATRKFAAKIATELDNETEIVVRIKERSRDGKRHRYEVQSRVDYPGKSFSADGESWDANAAVRSSLQDLVTNIRSTFTDPAASSIRKDPYYRVVR